MTNCPDCDRLLRCVIALLDHAFEKDVRQHAEALVEELYQSCNCAEQPNP